MSIATALTIIAISMLILALLGILAVIFLVRLVLHLIAFEKTLASELAQLRELGVQLRETTEQVGKTVHDVQVAARRVGGAVGTVASLLSLVVGRSRPSNRREPTRPWWVTGASLGWNVLKRRRQKTKKRTAKSKRTALTSGSDSSLTM
ncbi:MAG: hypothetical protein C7B45_08980 [Sulfobacillus acidophilus]|uniref:DUF948 domain-containing protein n=1 Tax=Sulfobacillus acidophilus TaxID=53633 RepID=A0A2T2WI55_9FIRM|nr:MAG: hypothetical protein C7B45_08980 [Sulfobacillus acidophilus]